MIICCVHSKCVSTHGLWIILASWTLEHVRQHPMHAKRDTNFSNSVLRLPVCLSVKRIYRHIWHSDIYSGIFLVSFESHRRYRSSVGTLLAGALNTRRLEKFPMFDRNCRLSQSRYEVGPWLVRIANRKISVSISMTLSNLERRDARDDFFSGGSP